MITLTWTCQECGATGLMPSDILANVHDCTRGGPFRPVARLIVQAMPGSTDPEEDQTMDEKDRATEALPHGKECPLCHQIVMTALHGVGWCVEPTEREQS